MKRFLLVILSAIMALSVLAFAGCKKIDSNEGEDKSLQKILDKKEFVLGLDDSFPPMGFRNENDEIVGFDIDVAREVCSRMGVELKIQPIAWDSKQFELDNGNIDCVWNGMSIDEERQEKMNLSEPYMENKMVLVVLSDSGYDSQASLKDKKIAVQNGSTAQKILNASDFVKTVKEVVGFGDNIMAFTDLDGKGVDAVFIDKVFADYYIKTNNKNYTVLTDGLQ